MRRMGQGIGMQHWMKCKESSPDAAEVGWDEVKQRKRMEKRGGGVQCSGSLVLTTVAPLHKMVKHY